ncbi:MAG: hypothetical protein RSB71_02675, partial [Bacilli bacterium]
MKEVITPQKERFLDICHLYGLKFDKKINLNMKELITDKGFKIHILNESLTSFIVEINKHLGKQNITKLLIYNKNKMQALNIFMNQEISFIWSPNYIIFYNLCDKITIDKIFSLNDNKYIPLTDELNNELTDYLNVDK